ncbi:MAG: hypothetical protein DME04_21820 [Candidatus Rokuibacteriota bacterium]|nr:MAG: hypothetical protein DME04_21820 [Candidatus Rokubacteria bacterium]
MTKDQMSAGHGHQLEQHRLGDAIDLARAAEDVVTRIEALGHFDAGHAVKGKRHDLVDELIAHCVVRACLWGALRGPRPARLVEARPG